MISKPFHLSKALVVSLIAALASAGLLGCGSGVSAIGTFAPGAPTSLALSPSITTVAQGETVSFLTGSENSSACTWAVLPTSLLSSMGNGQFLANSSGSATVSATCGPETATASVVVRPSIKTSSPITITEGGTYSGNWVSTDHTVPAVFVHTDEPVTIKNSTVTGPGDLIAMLGVTTGAKVTIDNVTGTALDPGVSGLQRGRFIVGSMVDQLTVTHDTSHGASLAVLVGAWPMSLLKIRGLAADGMEDRASNGHGGFLNSRPTLGHFVAIVRTSIPAGADISWNQVIDTIGSSSVEDMFNFYDAQGSPANPISVHDNYMEGGGSPVNLTDYTGTGIITDGPGNDPGPTPAYITVTNNQLVHTSGGGYVVAAGHDISMRGNRTVSCGQDATGHFYSMPYAAAIAMFNYYGTANFANNHITASEGGMVIQSSAGKPIAADNSGGLDPAIAANNNSTSPNAFTDPCFNKDGTMNKLAETEERLRWVAKAALAGQLIGDHH